MPPLHPERPLIGVTGPDVGGFAGWFFARWMLWRCGARAVRITPARHCDIATLDGLILGGGADVSEPLATALAAPSDAASDRPLSVLSWRHQMMAPLIVLLRWLSSRRAHGQDLARDRCELALLAEADARQLPVLGICRGAQLMSMARGGTLLHRVDELYEERPRLYTALPRRRVQLAPGTLLQQVLGRESIFVNSLHHHAVEVAGTGFRVAAREPEGIVQALEQTQPVLWWGVQWHPEFLPQSREQQRLVRYWVDTCRRRERQEALAGVEAGEVAGA
ncbi:MAG TPA: gamma-glutamyl-gamma-aminobutyrate hydrolase family protein [Polyangiaceae bacterium]|nr:gamma-glutamyl-gamma-aminobutyrate hydrolase family protein [Polyangiaceae bacterium]